MITTSFSTPTGWPEAGSGFAELTTATRSSSSAAHLDRPAA
ncbi:hypothetical protein [Mycobacterium sp. URHB0021]